MYFAIALLCLRERSWELTNTGRLMSVNVDEIGDLLFSIVSRSVTQITALFVV